MLGMIDTECRLEDAYSSKAHGIALIACLKFVSSIVPAYLSCPGVYILWLKLWALLLYFAFTSDKVKEVKSEHRIGFIFITTFTPGFLQL